MKDPASINPAKKAALYCRVSTYDQTRGSFTSTESQEEYLRQHCKFNNWEVFKVYTDDAKSGSSLDRPEFKKLLNDANQKKFNVIVATKLDRISRNNRDWFKLIEEFESIGVEIAVLNPQMDTNTAVGKMVRDILIVFAQFERELGSERTFEKMYAMAKKGMWLGGVPPIGYKLQDKKLQIVPEDAKIIKTIYDKYLRKQLPSFIANYLNNKGIKTPIKEYTTGRKYGGKRFDTNLVLKILRIPIYAGFVNFNDELFSGKHEKIISKKHWDTVQATFHKQSNPRLGTGEKLLLTGITTCGICGSAMTTSGPTAKKQKDGSTKYHWYYRCTKKRSSSGDCNNRQVNAKNLEDFILKIISNLANDDKYITETFNSVIKNHDRKMKAVRNEIKKLDGLISENERKISRLTDVITEHSERSISPLLAKLESLTNESSQLLESRSKHQLFQNGLQNKGINLEVIHKRFSDFISIMDRLTQSDKRNIINILIKKITLKYPIGSKKGVIIIQAWNKASQSFKYDSRSGVCFTPFGSSGGT